MQLRTFCVESEEFLWYWNVLWLSSCDALQTSYQNLQLTQVSPWQSPRKFHVDDNLSVRCITWMNKTLNMCLLMQLGGTSLSLNVFHPFTLRCWPFHALVPLVIAKRILKWIHIWRDENINGSLKKSKNFENFYLNMNKIKINVTTK